MKGLLFLLALAGGMMMPIQGVMNARLAQTVGGATWASAISALLVSLTLVCIGLTTHSSPTLQAAISRAPWWSWGGGLCGALVLFSIAYAAPRTGILFVTAALLLGQVLTSIVIDTKGLLGMDVRTLSVPRAAAILALFLGTALLLLDALRSR